MVPSPPWSLHTRRHRWYDHVTISYVVPSDIGTPRRLRSSDKGSVSRLATLKSFRIAHLSWS
jgi:hypothetical protein